ncbi:MAG: hypothetical protein ACRD3I_04450, partial [Terriglobales bacterium]
MTSHKQKCINRRKFLGLASTSLLTSLSARGAKAAPAILAGASSKTIRIEEVSVGYDNFLYRTPIKFGGMTLDRVTLLNVDCVVRTADGRTAEGFGSMPLGNVWSFPSRVLSYDATLGAMKLLAARIANLTVNYKESGHPLDINTALEPAYLAAAGEVSKKLNLAEPIPKLCTLVTASPFDAAIHDAYGKAHGLNCYHTYGREFMTRDLAHFLTPEFKGEYLDRYVLKEPKPRMPLYHLI